MPPTEPLPAGAADDRQLLAAARNGDDGAFAQLIERHDPLLSQLAGGLLDGEGTDPMLTESYVRAYRSIGRQPGPPVPWLVRTTYLTCLAEARRRERRRQGGPGRLPQRRPDPAAGPLAAAGPDERAAFILLDEAGMDEQEVAEALGAPVATVRTLAARARATVEAWGSVLEPVVEAASGEPANPDPAGAEPASTEPASTEPASTEPASTEPANPEPANPEPANPGSTGEAVEPTAQLGPEPGEPEPAVASDADAGGDADVVPAARTRVAVVAIPEHGPDFWPELGRRLLAERNAPALRVDELPLGGDRSPGREPAKAPPVAMQRRAPRSARRRRQEPDSVDGLAVEAKRQRPRRSARQTLGRVAISVLVVIVIGAAVAGVVHYASSAHTPVRTDSVSQISEGTIVALDVPSIAMSYTRTVVDAEGRSQVRRYSLLRTRSGSFVLIDITDGSTIAYDAPTNTWRGRSTSTGPAGTPVTTSSEQTGLAAGPPDPAPTDAALPDAELDRALRALSDVTDAAAIPMKVHGTPAWQLDGSLDDGSELGADRVELIVDQAQLLPIAVEYRSGHRLVREVRFDRVTLNAPAPGPFTIDLGVGVTPVARGFVPANLSSVSAALGFDPLRPSYLPGGFELTGTTLRAAGRIVTLRYQRGFQQIVVSTRISPVTTGQTWTGAFPGKSTPVKITKGLYRGTTALRSETLGSLPALWGSDGHLAFTVWGDLTDQQLVEVVETLH